VHWLSIAADRNTLGIFKVEEKRENFSPRKLRKPGEREEEEEITSFQPHQAD
jgi:hypothetical protein